MKIQLSKDNVEHIIVTASNTKTNKDLTTAELEIRRSQEGYPDIGYHYVITRDGYSHAGIHTSICGTHTYRFDATSIGILIIGGHTSRGNPVNNYNKVQLIALAGLLDILTLQFPNAKIVGSGELIGGTNPHFNVGEFYDSRRKGNETPTDQ